MMMLLFLTIIIGFLVYSVRLVRNSSQSLGSAVEYIYGHERGGEGFDTGTLWRSAVASNFQAASNLFIGIQLGFIYGSAILLTGFAYALGFVAIWFAYRRLSSGALDRLFYSDLSPYDRILAGLKFNKHRIYTLAVYLTILFVAVLEVWIVVRFFSDTAGAVAELRPNELFNREYLEVFGAAIVTGALFFYVYVGGYRAIAITDRFQFALIVTMFLIFIISVCYSAFFSTAGSPFVQDDFIFGEGRFEFAPEAIGIALAFSFLNFLQQFTDPQQWQRARASNSVSDYLSSLLPTAAGVSVTWTLPVLGGCFLAGYVNGMNSDIVAAYPFTLFIKEFRGDEFWIYVAVAITAVGVSGIIAAALSTADTVILAFLSRLFDFSDGRVSLNEARQRGVGASIVVFYTALVLYLFEPKLENVILAVYSAQAIFAVPFSRYILTAGEAKFQLFFPSHAIAITFILFMLLSVLANFQIVILFPDSQYYLPIIYFVVGAVYAIFFMKKAEVGNE